MLLGVFMLGKKVVYMWRSEKYTENRTFVLYG